MDFIRYECSILICHLKDRNVLGFEPVSRFWDQKEVFDAIVTSWSLSQVVRATVFQIKDSFTGAAGLNVYSCLPSCHSLARCAVNLLRHSRDSNDPAVKIFAVNGLPTSVLLPGIGLMDR